MNNEILDQFRILRDFGGERGAALEQDLIEINENYMTMSTRNLTKFHHEYIKKIKSIIELDFCNNLVRFEDLIDYLEDGIFNNYLILYKKLQEV